MSPQVGPTKDREYKNDQFRADRVIEIYIEFYLKEQSPIFQTFK